jgi:hypothetical protein
MRAWDGNLMRCLVFFIHIESCYEIFIQAMKKGFWKSLGQWGLGMVTLCYMIGPLTKQRPKVMGCVTCYMTTNHSLKILTRDGYD